MSHLRLDNGLINTKTLHNSTLLVLFPFRLDRFSPHCQHFFYCFRFFRLHFYTLILNKQIVSFFASRKKAPDGKKVKRCLSLLQISFSFHVVHLSECGKSRGCWRVPSACTTNCTFALTWRYSDNTINFEVIPYSSTVS